MKVFIFDERYIESLGGFTMFSHQFTTLESCRDMLLSNRVNVNVYVFTFQHRA